MCVPNLSHNSLFKDRYDQRGWGVGEGEFEGVLVLRISSDRDDQMGTKRKRKKSLDQYSAPPPPTKKKGQNPIPGYAETIRNLQNTQKNSLCKSRYQKKYLNFPLKISNPNNPLIIPVI